jgi:pimeloyl-ACP methyl ester carboxylesterase
VSETVEIALADGTIRRFGRETVRVPADHDSPSEGTLALRFARLRSRFPDRTPIVFLAGGPGDSGIGWLRHAPFREVFERAALSRDLILLDQRGCGDSEEDMRCAALDFREGWLGEEAAALAMLSDQAQRTLSLRPAQVSTRYTPWQSARDLAYLADALNAPQIHLWGYSYGTHLAQAALKAIPDRVARVALCGFEGPDQTLKLPSRIQAQLERLHALAARQGVCPDLCERMARTHARLQERPVTVRLADGAPTTVGLFGLRWIVSSWVGVSNRFVQIPALYRSLEEGDLSRLERAAQGFAKMLTQRTAVFYLKDSASGATAARLQRIAQERHSCLLDDAANFPFPAIREAWRQRDLGDTFRAPLCAAHPLFILTGSLDGFTPTENALESLKTLPNAVHRQIVGAAHNDLLLCPAAIEDLVRFFDGESLSGEPYSIAEPQMIG